MTDALTTLRTAAIPALPDDATAATFWQRTRDARERFSLPADRAMVASLYADRLGYAFLAGYQSALCALVPTLDRQAMASLCATEEGGAHPRAIKSALSRDGDGYVLDGSKRWATAATEATELFVLASEGEREDGKPQLRLARVASNAAGVTLAPMDQAPFAPEIAHATVRFERARVALLEGDGWDAYVRPFRTIEDVHVHCALVGYLVSVARRSRWPATELDALSLLACAARDLSQRDPNDASTHSALAGLLAQSESLLERCDAHWSAVDSAERARWSRDRALLRVASSARSARQEKAHATLDR